MFKPVIRIEIENKRHFHHLSLFHLHLVFQQYTVRFTPLRMAGCVTPKCDCSHCHTYVLPQAQQEDIYQPWQHIHMKKLKLPMYFHIVLQPIWNSPSYVNTGQTKSTTISFLSFNFNSMLCFLKIFLQVCPGSFRKYYFCSFQICKAKIKFKRSLYIKHIWTVSVTSFKIYNRTINHIALRIWFLQFSLTLAKFYLLITNNGI